MHYSGSAENRLFLVRARKQAAQYTADGVETQKITVFDGRTLTHSVKKITIAGQIAPALKAAFAGLTADDQSRTAAPERWIRLPHSHLRLLPSRGRRRCPPP
jgi:hypothetical protein